MKDYLKIMESHLGRKPNEAEIGAVMAAMVETEAGPKNLKYVPPPPESIRKTIERNKKNKGEVRKKRVTEMTKRQEDVLWFRQHEWTLDATALVLGVSISTVKEEIRFLKENSFLK